VGCFTRAARLLGAAAALRTSGGFPRSLLEREDVERATAAARAALGDTAFEAAWEAAQAVTLDQAITYALSEGAGSAELRGSSHPPLR
jgi:hypothetical protein